MLLVDTSVWIDHLRSSEHALTQALELDDVSTHPFIVQELGLGSIRNRDILVDALERLSQVKTLTHDELMTFVDSNKLWGKGLSMVDAHLLGSATITPNTTLWTRDKRLKSTATKLGVPTAK